MLRCILLQDSIALRTVGEKNTDDLPAQTPELRDSAAERLCLNQTLLAGYGAAGEAFRLVAISNDKDVIQAAWSLLSELCYDGNPKVQVSPHGWNKINDLSDVCRDFEEVFAVKRQAVHAPCSKCSELTPFRRCARFMYYALPRAYFVLCAALPWPGYLLGGAEETARRQVFASHPR